MTFPNIDSIIVPKIIIYGPPASGQHTVVSVLFLKHCLMFFLKE